MEELFDVCTPDGLPTGTTAPRSRAHAQGLWHRSSHLWIVDGRGWPEARILLQRRHPSKATDPGRWDIAVAGHVSAGQTPLEAVVREAREELGLVLDPTQLSFLGAWPKEYVEPTTGAPGFIDREWQHLFAGVWNDDLLTLELQADEVTAVRWMDLGEYRGALEAGDPAYVGRWEDWPPFEAWFTTKPPRSR